MNKTILVSNRLPLEFKIVSDQIEIKPSVGGLATGLKSVHAAGNSLWIGWSGLTDEQLGERFKDIVAVAAQKERCYTVSLDEKDVRDFYLGFSNKTLWPLFHYFPVYTEYEPEQWLAYKKVNEKFAESILAQANEGDVIWIHDYHLLLLPQMLRKRNPSLTIGFFLHIPFPAFELFRMCPWREELILGLLGADLIGFHTYDYVQHFLNSVKRISGIPVKFNEIMYQGRNIKVDSFPMGIDYKKYNDSALLHQNPNRDKSSLLIHLEEHAKRHPQSKLILSIDRMDYTKGIPNRIKAFEYFLEKYPQYIENVQLLMLAVPSRSDVPQYGKLKKETDELVGRINGKFATVDWTPVLYFYRSMPFDNLIDLYTFADIGLITPLRDGMNLVIKEFVATRIHQDGVLIISEMAGVASELHEALQINPNSREQFADTLKQGIEMPVAEQQSRIKAMQKRLSRYTVEKWAQDFMTALNNPITENDAVVCKRLNKEHQDKLLTAFAQAKKRLLLLDYDGTLINFIDNPQEAAPDPALYELLDRLSENENTEVTIVTGRDKETIEKWFGHKNYTLITDHGVWIRRNYRWKQLEHPLDQWKEHIKPIIESFVDRTPGTFVEEKKYSLVWHYRKADPDMAEVRVRELKILLMGLVADNGLSVMSGDKVLEVKDQVVNKGKTVSKLLNKDAFDFIFAVGDDITDEYMFVELPVSSHTVKVGTGETIANYYVQQPQDLRRLLQLFNVCNTQMK